MALCGLDLILQLVYFMKHCHDSDNILLAVRGARFSVRYDGAGVKDHIYINNADSTNLGGETGIMFRNYTKNMAMRMNFGGDFVFGEPGDIFDSAI